MKAHLMDTSKYGPLFIRYERVFFLVMSILRNESFRIIIRDKEFAPVAQTLQTIVLLGLVTST